MRVLMLQASARQQDAGLEQRTDYGLVGVALFAFVVDNAFSRKTGRMIGEGAVLIDGIWNCGVDFSRVQQRLVFHPDIEVFAAMSRCGVYESRTGIIGYVIPLEKRNDKIIPAPATRVGAGHFL